MWKNFVRIPMHTTTHIFCKNTYLVFKKFVMLKYFFQRKKKERKKEKQNKERKKTYIWRRNLWEKSLFMITFLQTAHSFFSPAGLNSFFPLFIIVFRILFENCEYSPNNLKHPFSIKYAKKLHIFYKMCHLTMKSKSAFLKTVGLNHWMQWSPSDSLLYLSQMEKRIILFSQVLTKCSNLMHKNLYEDYWHDVASMEF